MIQVYTLKQLPQTSHFTRLSFIFVVRTLKIDTPGEFQVYNTVLLTTVTRSPELTHST